MHQITVPEPVQLLGPRDPESGERPPGRLVHFDELVALVLNDPQWGKTTRGLKQAVKLERMLDDKRNGDGHVPAGTVLALEDADYVELRKVAASPSAPYQTQVAKQLMTLFDAIEQAKEG